MSNRKTLEEKIAEAKLEAEQMQNRVKELLQQQKTQERKDRNHRLCLRGGKLEKLLPELARLTEEQFEIFVEKCLLTNFTRKTLAELAPSETVAVATPEDTKTAQAVSTSGNGKSTETPRVAG